ncbi:unnamed protein product [Toxocara canis]|uniref:LUD_dom domain-containing protein n=1 Tax=Toxocara canis TaxID=6265 RepID=A0A183U3M9_TOXCA|nr:unnamed protein product [Toxocara canis]
MSCDFKQVAEAMNEELFSNYKIAKRTIAKLAKLKPELLCKETVEAGYKEVRRTIGNSLLDPDDMVSSLLKDAMKGADTEERNDEKMVYISEQLEKQSKRKIRFEYDITPVGLEKPTELLVLDGYSLTTTDLVKCEQGRCIIQVTR